MRLWLQTEKTRAKRRFARVIPITAGKVIQHKHQGPHPHEPYQNSSAESQNRTDKQRRYDDEESCGISSSTFGGPGRRFARPDNEDDGRKSDAKYDFDGSVNGVALRVKVRVTPDGSFEFKASVQGADFSGTTNPVRVTLEVGMNGGSAVKESGRSFEVGSR
jgi:hypothetical protein